MEEEEGKRGDDDSPRGLPRPAAALGLATPALGPFGAPSTPCPASEAATPCSEVGAADSSTAQRDGVVPLVGLGEVAASACAAAGGDWACVEEEVESAMLLSWMMMWKGSKREGLLRMTVHAHRGVLLARDATTITFHPSTLLSSSFSTTTTSSHSTPRDSWHHSTRTLQLHAQQQHVEQRSSCRSPRIQPTASALLAGLSLLDGKLEGLKG